MWELRTPDKVKLVIGILAANQHCLDTARATLEERFGQFDFVSDIWQFDQTNYYVEQTGQNILRQFVCLAKPLSPGRLAKIKLKTNRIEKSLAEELDSDLPRPVNLDPGIIEPAKLILATTKNYSHRVYIGKKIYAEVTLIYDNGKWQSQKYTYPDYKQQCYFDFFNKVRTRLLEQLRS